MEPSRSQNTNWSSEWAGFDSHETRFVQHAHQIGKIDVAVAMEMRQKLRATLARSYEVNGKHASVRFQNPTYLAERL